MAVEPMEVNSQSAKPNKYNENFDAGYGRVLAAAATAAAAAETGKERERETKRGRQTCWRRVDDSWQL